MSFAPAAWDARAGRRVVAAAIASALQVAFYFLILQDAVEPTAPQASTPLEITMLQTVRRFSPTASPLKRRAEMPRRLPAPQEVPLPPAITAPVTPLRTAEPAPHAPVDWRRAIQGAVRAQSRSPAGKLQFGFPRSPPPGPGAPPAFGWDYAHTHRLVALPEGGMLINVTDRCALVFYGFLFPVCKIGKMPANGQLFEHLHDRRSEPPSGLP
jgi:hypothetical protein